MTLLDNENRFLCVEVFLSFYIFYCSLEECGRYLETLKVYENKPADIIQGQMDTDYTSRVSIYLSGFYFMAEVSMYESTRKLFLFTKFNYEYLFVVKWFYVALNYPSL